MTEQQQWFLPTNTPSAYESFWGDITNIPNNFAEKYTNGRKLTLGFGGSYSIIQTYSLGPAIAAISTNIQNGEMDFQNTIYYQFPKACNRDSNYFNTGNFLVFYQSYRSLEWNLDY